MRMREKIERKILIFEFLFVFFFSSLELNMRWNARKLTHEAIIDRDGFEELVHRWAMHEWHSHTSTTQDTQEIIY